MESKKVVLFGAGGSGREIARLVEKINDVEKTFDLLGFIDDDPAMEGLVLNGVPVLGGTEWLVAHKDEVWYRQESCALFRQPHKPAVRCGYPSSRVTSR